MPIQIDKFRSFRKVMRETSNKSLSPRDYLLRSELTYRHFNIAGVPCCCQTTVCTTLGRFIRRPNNTVICHGTRRGTRTKYQVDRTWRTLASNWHAYRYVTLSSIFYISFTTWYRLGPVVRSSILNGTSSKSCYFCYICDICGHFGALLAFIFF